LFKKISTLYCFFCVLKETEHKKRRTQKCAEEEREREGKEKTLIRAKEASIRSINIITNNALSFDHRHNHLFLLTKPN
jgi:hypothetical protein